MTIYITRQLPPELMAVAHEGSAITGGGLTVDHGPSCMDWDTRVSGGGLIPMGEVATSPEAAVTDLESGKTTLRGVLSTALVTLRDRMMSVVMLTEARFREEYGRDPVAVLIPLRSPVTIMEAHDDLAKTLGFSLWTNFGVAALDYEPEEGHKSDTPLIFTPQCGWGPLKEDLRDEAHCLALRATGVLRWSGIDSMYEGAA